MRFLASCITIVFFSLYPNIAYSAQASTPQEQEILAFANTVYTIIKNGDRAAFKAIHHPCIDYGEFVHHNQYKIQTYYETKIFGPDSAPTIRDFFLNTIIRIAIRKIYEPNEYYQLSEVIFYNPDKFDITKNYSSEELSDLYRYAFVQTDIIKIKDKWGLKHSSFYVESHWPWVGEYGR